MMPFSVVPSPIPVVHVPRTLSPQPDPDTGNYEFVEGTPEVRKVMSLAQYGKRGSSDEIHGPDVTERIHTHLQMVCANPRLYNPSDLVFVHPELDATGAWVPDTGEVYFVDGVPFDERDGPWPSLLAAFGGSLKLTRVT